MLEKSMCGRWIIAGLIMVSPPSLAAQAVPELRLTRDLRIDAAEHDLTFITPPGGMAVSTSGVIVFSQNQDGVLRFFDARGASLGTFGRKGQGPGEFQIAARLSWIAGTLVVSDGTTRRFTLVSPDRKLIRTVPWLANVSVPGKAGEGPRVRASIPRSSYADGSQLMTVSLATGSPVPEWPGGEKPGIPLIRVDSTGAFQRLIAWSPRRDCSVPFDAGAGMGSGTLMTPFCAQAIEDVSPDGSRISLAFLEPGSTPAFRVTAFRASGDTIYSRSYPFQPVSIPSGVKDSARAARARGSQSQRDAAAKMPIPDSYPPVSRVLVGRDETTWLEVYGAKGERVWQVLDARGSVIGRIGAPPPNTHFMVVSRDAVWAIETDGDGLQHVVRFRVGR